MINAILTALLMVRLKIGGIALGSSLAAAYNCLLLYKGLIKKVGTINWEDTLSNFIKIAALSVIIGYLSNFLWYNLALQKYIRIMF